MKSDENDERSMEERTRFLYAITPTPEQEAEARAVEDWIDSDPELAAKYIVWLQDAMGD